MDILTGFEFSGLFGECLYKATIRDVQAAVKRLDFSEKTDQSIPWIPFKVRCVINGRPKCFSGKFRYYFTENQEMFAETGFDIKGVDGWRFEKLMQKNAELISTTILEFVTGQQPRSKETGLPNSGGLRDFSAEVA